LNYQLKGNCSQGNIFDMQINSDTSITFQKNCMQCSPLEVGEVTNELKEVIVYPNPVNDFISIKGLNNKDYSIKIFDSNSKLISSKSFSEVLTIDTSNFSVGIYFYTIEDLNKNKQTGKFIKQ